MSADDYEGREQEYQALRTELHLQIDKKFQGLKSQEDLEFQATKAKTGENLDLKQKVHGGNQKEHEDRNKAHEINANTRLDFLKREWEKEKKKADDFAEVKIFEKKWGRLEARELACGSDDTIVIELKKNKALAERQEQLERDKLQSSVGEDHKLISSKGQYTQLFNDKDRDR